MTMRVSHFLGGVLLVAGTTIGAGMLGTPILTGFAGFYPSLCLFALCWLVMLCSAFFLLDVNLATPKEPNMISMAQRTLGWGGKALSWIVYLLLLYSLIAAYILASGPLFSSAIAALTGWEMPQSLSLFMLPLLFGAFVYFGTLGVDLVNRVLMVGLVLSYLMVVGVAPYQVSSSLLEHADFRALPVAVTVVITSFGYHIIIPTLVTYMDHNRKRLTSALILGSLISLLIYSVWQWIALGIVPLDGPNGLASAYMNGGAVTASIARIVQCPWIRLLAQFFSFFAIVTSFLGVSLALSDFLTDGLKIKKSWEGRLLAIGLTFIPPLFFVFKYPEAFLMALEHGGALVALLLIFLPALMAWKIKGPALYRKWYGKALLIFVMLFALGVVALDLFQQLGWLKTLIAPYV